MIVRKITGAEVLALRAEILRPGQPLDASRYAGDASGAHFGLFTEAGALISVVTAHPEAKPEFGESLQYRIRGMATAEAFQNQGLGKQLLLELLQWGRGNGITLFWCNARERAIPFYERMGFTVESELFDLPKIGPHKVMKKIL